MSSLIYFFKQSLEGFTRNLSTTLGSIITIFLSLFIIGIFLVGGSLISNVVTSIESEVSITAYVADDASEQDITTVEHFIQGLDGVSNVTFTTKDEALENFRNMTSNADIVDSLEGNPLPASINVELSDPQKVEEVAQAIEANDTFKKIADEDDPANSLKYGQKYVERLFSLGKYMRYLLVLAILTLSFILMYRWVPAGEHRSVCQWPGALFCALAWVGFSWVFSLYVSVSDKFGAYGYIGTIMVAMMWMYYCLMFLLIGGCINAVIEKRRAARDTDAEEESA